MTVAAEYSSQVSERLAALRAKLLALAYSLSGAAAGAFVGIQHALYVLAPLLTSRQGVHKLVYGTGSAAQPLTSPSRGPVLNTQTKGTGGIVSRAANDGYIVVKPLPPFITGQPEAPPSVPGSTPYTGASAASLSTKPLPASAAPPAPSPSKGSSAPASAPYTGPAAAPLSTKAGPASAAAHIISSPAAALSAKPATAGTGQAAAGLPVPVPSPSPALSAADKAHITQSGHQGNPLDTAYEVEHSSPQSSLAPVTPIKQLSPRPSPGPPQGYIQGYDKLSEYSQSQSESATPSESTTPGVTPRASASTTPRAFTPPAEAASSHHASSRAVHAEELSTTMPMTAAAQGAAATVDKKHKKKNKKDRAAAAAARPFKALSRAISGDRK